MTDPFESVGEAKDLLEEALSLVDELELDDAEAPKTIARIAAELRRLPDPAKLRASVAPEDLDRFDDDLEELIRLNAVLVASIRTDQETLITRLKSVRESRRDLQYYGKQEASGVRCDVSG